MGGEEFASFMEQMNDNDYFQRELALIAASDYAKGKVGAAAMAYYSQVYISDPGSTMGRTLFPEVFHYAYGRVLPVHFELYADARRYDCVNAALKMPVQVFQGRRDELVDAASVERWCLARADSVELHLLDDDHQLLSSLDFIWTAAARFLGLD